MRRVIVIACVALLLAAAGAAAGRFLVVNRPHPADAILVVNGEWENRPARGLELLRQGYAPRLILSTDFTMIYGQRLDGLAAAWAAGQTEAARISQCANNVDSTRAEALADRRCLAPPIRSVLLVTSDFHTRRARTTFAREMPGVTFYVAAVSNGTGSDIRHWWRTRSDAKQVFFEWSKLIWWCVVDRWH